MPPSIGQMCFGGNAMAGSWHEPSDRSPDALRRVFGRNLRELSRRCVSISQLCRDLGINRTQFNRYLNGEAFPRPDILSKICTYFEVDARILLEPLEALSRPPELPSWASIGAVLKATAVRPVDRDILPDGLYLHYRRSYFVGDALSSSMVKINRDAGGNVRVRGFISRGVADGLGVGTSARMRRLHGVIFAQNVGFAYITTLDQLPVMALGGMEPRYLGHERFYFGSTISTQDVMTPSPVLMERVEATPRATLAARHKIGTFPRSKYPALVRGFFDRYTPFPLTY